MSVKNLKHRAVIEIHRGVEIPQEPEMMELKQTYEGMETQERERTLDYLSQEATPGKSHSCRVDKWKGGNGK